jgi:putative DNA primase/helicase
MYQGKTKHSSSETQIDSDETDSHRNTPTPDPACLYGLVGEVAMAGSKGVD